MDSDYVLNIDSVFFLLNDETVLLLKEVCLSSRSPTHTVTAAVFRSLFISVHMDSGEKKRTAYFKFPFKFAGPTALLCKYFELVIIIKCHKDKEQVASLCALLNSC